MATERSLTETLSELAELLSRQGEARWAAELRRDLELVERDDFYGVERFLGHFGGTGSLGDVYFHPANGNAAGEDEASVLNERFLQLTSHAHDVATALRRSRPHS